MNRFYYILIFIFSYTYPGFAQSHMDELSVYIQLRKGNYQATIDSVDKFNDFSTNKNLLLAKMKAFMALGNYQDAQKTAAELNKNFTGAASALELEMYLEMDDFEMAKNALLQNLKSNDKISLFELFNNPEYGKLIGSELIDSILKTNNYSKTEKQIFQVQKLINNEKYEQAEFMLDGIISRNERIADAYYLKSKVLANTGFDKQALDQINIALSIKSNPSYYYQRADMLIRLEKYYQALLDVNKLVRMQPACFDNYIMQSKLYMLSGEYSKAVSLSNQLIDLELNNADLYYVNSKSNYELGNNLQALKAVNQLMDLKVLKEAYELRGDIYMKTKTYQYAIKDYSMFLDMEPYNARIYSKKGMARYYAGDTKGACSDWQKAVRYGSYDAVQYTEKYCK